MARFLTVLVAFAALTSPITANGQSWETNPSYGARRDAYGPGVHMDATGRAYRDSGGPALGGFRPDAYGPGIGMDGTGRAIRPSYDDDDLDLLGDDEDE